MTQPPPPPAIEIKVGEDSMSSTLLAFADPALEASTNAASYRSALTLAVLAWNISLLPESKQQTIVDSRLAPLMELYNDRDKATVKQIVEMLIHRRLNEFPKHLDFIVGFDLDEDVDPPRLSVTTSGAAAPGAAQ